MKKMFVIAFLSLFVYLFLPLNTFAANMNVTCPITPSGCSIDGTNPLFTTTADGVWYPGRFLTKTINMKNGGTQTREMALKGTGTTVSDTLKNMMNLSLTSSGGTVIWSGSLTDFYSQSNINLGIFDSGASLDYNMTVSMNINANDDYQGIQSVFDLTLGFWGDPISTPTSAPTPGVVLGAGVSAPVCNDQKPGSAPLGLTAIAGLNSITLTWNKASDPVSYYLVTYGTYTGSQTYGNPNVGGSGTTGYTISGLSGRTTYYFRIRAGNGCAPGEYSSEASATPSGGFIEGVAPGFEAGVLGEATKSAELNGESPTPTTTVINVGQVKGLKTILKNKIFIFGLPIAFILLLIAFFINKKRKST